MAMDAKDLRTDSALSAPITDGNASYSQSSSTLQTNRNKSYQDIGSNSLGKVESQATRPCAIIGPDRVLPPPPASDVYLKKASVEPWSCNENVYRSQTDFTPKLPEYQQVRNISPRQTFQENMQRIMVPPTYNSNKNIEGHNSKSSKDMPLEIKYSEVPYSINHTINGQKSIRNPDIPMTSVNPAFSRTIHPHGWPNGVSARPLRPYGAPEFYQYSEFGNYPNTRPITRPLRTAHDEMAQAHAERLYHESNVRFKPYPAIKERYPQARYDYVSNYPNTFHPNAPFSHQKYDLAKSGPPHPYPMYSQVPMRRVTEPILDSYQRPNQPANLNPYHNQYIPPPCGPVPGNCIPNKMYSHPSEIPPKPITGKLPYDINNKIYLDYENNLNKMYPPVDNMYYTELNRQHLSKGEVPMHPGINVPYNVPPQYLYRKDNMPMKAFDNMHYRNMDQNIHGTSPMIRHPLQYSSSGIVISPVDSNASNEAIAAMGMMQEDCGYVSQSSTASSRSMESGNYRIQNDILRKNENFYSSNSKKYSKPVSRSDNSDKKGLNVRQFLQMWNEGEDEVTDTSNQTTTTNFPANSETISNQEQLYVLGLVNIPNEELSKYEHIQKISKLPENIKGYNSIELLDQYEQLVESPVLRQNKTPNLRDYQISPKAIPKPSPQIPRPVSPLDVEAKISQSVIHKEVGCNFEIKPCSPKMMNAELAAPVQTMLDERAIEKVINLGLVTPSVHHEKTENTMSCKMNSPYISNNDAIKNSNYTFQDLESNSGICLASLPRLDSDIELNFPEINQQFIDANKMKTTSDNLDQDVITNNHILNPEVAEYNIEKESSKLSKYRRNKSVSYDSSTDHPAHFCVVNRTDSVIIKNPDNGRTHDDVISNAVVISNEKKERDVANCIDKTVDDSVSTEVSSNIQENNIAIDFSLNRMIGNKNYATGCETTSESVKHKEQEECISTISPTSNTELLESETELIVQNKEIDNNNSDYNINELESILHPCDNECISDVQSNSRYLRPIPNKDTECLKEVTTNDGKVITDDICNSKDLSEKSHLQKIEQEVENIKLKLPSLCVNEKDHSNLKTLDDENELIKNSLAKKTNVAQDTNNILNMELLTRSSEELNNRELRENSNDKLILNNQDIPKQPDKEEFIDENNYKMEYTPNTKESPETKCHIYSNHSEFEPSVESHQNSTDHNLLKKEEMAIKLDTGKNTFINEEPIKTNYHVFTSDSEVENSILPAPHTENNFDNTKHKTKQSDMTNQNDSVEQSNKAMNEKHNNVEERNINDDSFSNELVSENQNAMIQSNEVCKDVGFNVEELRNSSITSNPIGKPSNMQIDIIETELGAIHGLKTEVDNNISNETDALKQDPTNQVFSKIEDTLNLEHNQQTYIEDADSKEYPRNSEDEIEEINNSIKLLHTSQESASSIEVDKSAVSIISSENVDMAEEHITGLNMRVVQYNQHNVPEEVEKQDPIQTVKSIKTTNSSLLTDSGIDLDCDILHNPTCENNLETPNIFTKKYFSSRLQNLFMYNEGLTETITKSHDTIEGKIEYTSEDKIHTERCFDSPPVSRNDLVLTSQEHEESEYKKVDKKQVLQETVLISMAEDYSVHEPLDGNEYKSSDQLAQQVHNSNEITDTCVPTDDCKEDKINFSEFNNRRPTLKRSLSDSALSLYNNNNEIKEQGNHMSKRRKIDPSEFLQHCEDEDISEIVQNNRRNSVSICNSQNVYILINDEYIIEEDDENSNKICVTEMPTELCNTSDTVLNLCIPNDPEIASISENEVTVGSEEVCAQSVCEETWVEDIGCVETIFNDDVAEDITISAPTSPDNLSLHENDDNISTDRGSISEMQSVEMIYKTPPIDLSMALSDVEPPNIQVNADVVESSLLEDLEHFDYEKSQKYFLDRDLLESDEIEHQNHKIDCYITNRNEYENINPMHKEYEDCCVDSCDFIQEEHMLSDNRENDLNYSLSSSPEVSSTTSEERSSGILLKITSINGSRKSEINNISGSNTNKVSYKLTELEDYSTSYRPLITKAAKKYIPPLKETRDLKVKLALPQHSLDKLKRLKMAKDEPLIEKPKRKMNPVRHEVPKKIKPKFEDVLRSIDEIQFKMQKDKNKKKHSIPKVVIKKNENGAHYASTPNKKSVKHAPDLTGRKWQPWVFIEKNDFVDKMALRNKAKAVYCHRKKTFVLAEKFKKYKSICTAKFVISQPHSDKASSGNLKYTIKLKHNY